jgi:serine/threonine-protein kinase
LTETLERLEAALADRYTLERELGRGRAVHLATDSELQRHEAIVARLDHPHILALRDSGRVDGPLRSVMPYVERESLPQSLDRERQLSVDESVRIVRSVLVAKHCVTRAPSDSLISFGVPPP